MEYRIDYLLTTELGVTLRKRVTEPVGERMPVAPRTRRRPRHGEIRQDLLRLAPEFLAPGEFLPVNEIAGRLRERVDYKVLPESVSNVLGRDTGRFVKATETLGPRRRRVRYALRPPTRTDET